MIFGGLFGGEKKRIEELIVAARAGDTEKVKQLLAKGVDINASEPESGDTALLAAIDKGQWATAEYLLTQGPDLTREDNSGNSPLYLAVSRGDSVASMVRRLLDVGAPVELGPMTGENAGVTPLHVCCAIGANECLGVLLARGASATKLLPDGSTPLHTAAIGGDQRTVELLCRAGASVAMLNNEKRTPLHNCGITGNAKVAAALIQQGAAVDGADAEGCTPLMHAVMKNHAEVARVVLDHGANPDVVVQTGDTPLYPLFIAAMNGYDEVVQVLLDKGVNVTAKVPGSASPVDAAKHRGHDSAARMIAAAIKKKKASEKEASMAQKEAESLWQRTVQAVAQRDSDGLRTLVNGEHFASLSVDARLLAACALGDAKIAREMLQAGADPNKPCKEGFDGVTPLVMTVGVSRSVEVASLLIDAGADVNNEWSEGTTPIFETTADQFYDLAKLLVARGANVNVRMGNGLTPLMFAAQNGASRCVELFLDAGADINAIEAEQGVGAFGLALNRLDLQLAEQLLARGAEPNFGSIETLPLAVAEHGSLAFIHALEARGCNLVRDDQRGRMAFVSARNLDPEVFDYLLNHGADPSEGNDFGYTPLILAALNNHHHLVRRYLSRGDDAAVRDVDGETALSLAIEKRHDESVAALREFHVEEGDYSSLDLAAAMLKAAQDGSLGSILNLRDSGVPINCCDEEGNSPLMMAVRAGHHGVVRSLYHLGADINHRNHAGETALGLAKASDSKDIVNTLQEFGALDAVTGEFGEFSAMFGGIPIYNAADTMFGRMSHPYKQKPPYDNEASDENDESGDSENDDDDRYVDESDEAENGTTIDSKLDLLSQVLDSDQVKEQLPEAVLEQLAQKLDHWRSQHEESELEDDDLAELNRLFGLFGLGEEEEAEEVERTPLFEALHAQDLAAVRKIVKDGGDINEVDDEGNTPLLIAVLTRNAKLVDELLKLGADPNKARPDGKGPLFGAVRVGEEKIVQTLLKGGAEVDATLSMEHNGVAVGGCTALYIAALFGHLPSCKVLVSNSASIDAANDLGYTPLMAAIEGDHEEVIDFFLKSGSNVNPEVINEMEVEGLGGAFPLYTATRKENLAVVKQLLKRGADVNRSAPNGWTSLKSAAQQGNFEIVKVLLDAGADPNIADDTNYTPLMNAVSGEHEEIVKILLKFHADPNVQSGENPEDDDWEPGRTALMDAAFSGNVAIARELLKGGANPNLLNSKGRTALYSAVISGNADMVALLLKSGADPNVFGNDDEKMSALDLALRRWASEDEDDRTGGISDVLELMLKKGMPSDRGSLQETALDLVTEGHLEVVDLLRKHGFSVDANYSKNAASQLFITAAIGDDRLQAAELLLKIGADVNYKSPAGLSVLSLATRNGAVRLGELLLMAGANVMDRNSANVLAYDLAVIYGHDELIDLLITHMNQVVPAVDRQADDGTTALMRATMAVDVKRIKELLAAGADASRRDRNGETPLSYALAHDLDEIVQNLRAAGVEKLPGDEVIGPHSIVHAGGLGALGTILDLLDSGTPIELTNDDGDTALTAAEVHPGVVKVLAKRGANLSHRNGEGKTAYMIAASSNRIRMMQALEEVGSPIDHPDQLDGMAEFHLMRAALDTVSHDELVDLMDADEQTMIETLRKKVSGTDAEIASCYPDVPLDSDEFLMACLKGDAVAVSKQVAEGADVNYVNDEGRTALAMAIQGLMQDKVSRRRERDFEQILDALLVAGADPRIGDFPYLVFAAMGKRLHLVNALIRAGASIDRNIGEGQTALFMSLLAPDAGRTADDRCALALLNAGADSSLRHESGAMPIHLAAASNYLGALQALLDRRPQDVDAKTNIGITPLMMAATEGHADAVRLLLKFGADRTLKDDEGMTAKDVAIKNSNLALLDVLG
jgi:ankyrin repeat protein